MQQISTSNPEENSQIVIANKYTLEDAKSIFYLMNAKPDTSIQLLEGRKKITFAEIKDLNARIQRKLENHHLIGQIASINLIFEKGKIKDYSTWAEFEREVWNTINNKTESISITWDISLKLPKYENPQRHTLKVRIGNSISPKDIMELVFNSDDPTELREKRAIGVVKVDFIDQVIAGELIERVTNWYDGLNKLPDEHGLQKFFIKNQDLIIGTIHNFTPIILLSLYHYYFITFSSLAKLYELTISNIQLLLIIFLFIFFIGSMLGKKFSRWTDKEIDKYKGLSQFEITKGDENAIEEARENNNKISKKLISKIIITIITTIVAFFVKHILEYFIN
ncbi:TPA: hypothetical protein NEG48_000295 [Elizabethkingia anophelis]|nr:hypothetical protein [Elizabethkingia anophelis]